MEYELPGMNSVTQMCGDWMDTHGQLLNLLINSFDLARHRRAASLLQGLHHQLKRTDAYQDLFADTGSWHRSDRPWQWMRLFEDSRIRIGLLAVSADQPIPMHDHPGSSGVLLLLSGSLEIVQYNLAVPYTQYQNSSPVLLQQIEDSTLTEGEATIFSDHVGNIHSLTSLESMSVVLQVLITPYQLAQRSWYFPVSTLQKPSSTLLANRWNYRSFGAHLDDEEPLGRDTS